MKYPDGTIAKLGDQVRMSNGELGTVVLSLDTNEFTEEFNEKEWGYLKKGVMIRLESGTLLHYEDPNIEEVFLEKKASD